MRVILPIGAVVVAFLACAPPVHEEAIGPRLEASETEIASARAASDELTKELAERLFAELEASGPLAAIEVCSTVAQEIARSHSADGLLVRRVSLKARNPADDPDDWERERLVELEALAAAGQLPDEVIVVEQTTAGPELRYLRPLRIAPPCLTCHGKRSAIEPEIVERLAELYPRDRATGYELGDLRGAVSVRLMLGSREPALETSGG